MSMRAGELRHRITLQKPVNTRAAFGDVRTTYADVATVWAAIEWGSGRRFESASQLNSEVQGVIRIRYRSDVLADWRIQYKARYFQIISIANIRERGEELQLNCKEALD
jgi:SPP1 family predicted phage head-tail adaptor